MNTALISSWAFLACGLLLRAQMGGEEGAVVATQCADPELDDSSESAALVSLVEYLRRRHARAILAITSRLSWSRGIARMQTRARSFESFVGGVFSEGPLSARLFDARHSFRRHCAIFGNPRQSF